MNIKELVDTYIRLRDQKDAIRKDYQAKVGKIDAALSKIETVFLKTLDKAGVESFRSPAGTVFKKTQTYVSTVDKEAFLSYVQEHDAWHLMDIRAGKVAVREFVEDTGTPPPGVNIRNELTVQVRRS